jgi:hypothetical protein
MSFNLRKSRSRRPIDLLREASGCEDIRPSDLPDGCEEKLRALANKFKKTALHGFYDKDRSDPYNTDYRMRFDGGNMGGRWRDLPGNSNHIDEDKDAEKHPRGDDPDENLRDIKIVENLGAANVAPPNESYVVKMRLNGEMSPEEVAKKNFPNQPWETDGQSVFVTVYSFDDALKIQRPGSVIEKKERIHK